MALADLLAKAKKSSAMPDDEGEEESPPSSKAESGFGDELASMLGVSDDDKSDFLAALGGYVRQCKAKGE